MVHNDCFVQTIQNHNYFCSICRKSIIDLSDLWRNIDIHMENQVMPDEYKNWRTKIKCRECNAESVTNYHFEYHKCQTCGCYNNDILGIIKNSSLSN